MERALGEMLRSSARARFLGWEDELSALERLFGDEGPRVMLVHGIAGIGKSALLDVLSTRAPDTGAEMIVLDCRALEPTVPGLLRGLSEALGCDRVDPGELPRVLSSRGRPVLIALDHAEAYRLLEAWILRVLVPTFPANARLLLAGRYPPSPAWLASPGWGSLLTRVELGSLSVRHAADLLRREGVDDARAHRIARLVQGHPLALGLAASALRARPDLELEERTVPQALETLCAMFLEDVPDRETRAALEAAALIRRTTLSLSRAMLPGVDAERAYAGLLELPFVSVASDGLAIHDAVREAIGRSVRARDPSRHTELRRRAWRQLIAEASTAVRDDLWRYTADVLYL
ncbi:MAG: transcriptional regulator, partial [Polyangiaceae bacterium]|nr:transcriptional regulator [Polyangiaceae bacterium]